MRARNTARRKSQNAERIGRDPIEFGNRNFSDKVLEDNGRAHLSKEVYRAWDWIQDAGFDNVNIDLISGMVGESWDNWKYNIEETLKLSPESVTIYQMELPFNTVYSKDILGNKIETPVADWKSKREWLDYAYDQFLDAGYHVSSGYTVVKNPEKVNFSYRDNLWQGSDLLATGIASFGHISGVHYQNKPDMKQYLEDLHEHGSLPINRAMRPTDRQRLIREMILQLKRGYLEVAYFRDKFDVNILEEWAAEFEQHRADELLTFTEERIELTRKGLLRVDGMLPVFFENEMQGIRYT